MIVGPKKSRLERTFERMVWKPDRMLLDDLVFRLRIGKDDTTWELGDECVVLFRTLPMLEQYRRLFARNPQLEIQNMLELGIYEGGGIPLWREMLEPKKMVAVDLREKIPTPYLDRYLERVKGETDISIYWSFDQADRERLRKVVAEDLEGKLDLVIDDASHMYEPTVASFETLFPLMRPGGLYIIEDWAWNHWEPYQANTNQWWGLRSPSEFAFQLMEGMGGTKIGVEHLEACRPFIALFRDDSELPPDFSLAKHVLRRPEPGYAWTSAP